MLNQERLLQLTDLMTEQGWDLLLLYGHAWRKDFFRCLLNVNFSGPHAVAALRRSGEVHVVVSDPWDAESVSASFDGRVSLARDFVQGLKDFVSGSTAGAIAIAGMELMEARFVQAVQQSTRPALQRDSLPAGAAAKSGTMFRWPLL